jgi:uncharacterized membrane protein YgcG
VHAGGNTIDASDLSVAAPPSIQRPTDWTGDGDVAAGDAATFEATETPRMVYVVFGERELLHREEIGDGSDGESDSGTEAEGDGESDSGSDGGSGGSSSSGGSGSSTATAPDVV